jgi:Uma2 family endonuclease
MATVPKTKTPATRTRFERRVVLRKISWATYEALLSDLEDSNVRLTYDRGDLEIMTVGPIHEWFKSHLRRMIDAATEELNIPIKSGGSTTFRRQLKQRGLEPDECYWVRHEPQVRGRKNLDLDVDPPPDLAIEVENTRSAVNKLAVYAGLGFPEVWRYNGQALRVAHLQPDGSYAWLDHSPTFPFLPLAELVRFLDQAEGMDETTWIRGFRAWVRAEIAPGYELA